MSEKAPQATFSNELGPRYRPGYQFQLGGFGNMALLNMGHYVRHE
jgi:hypothetical protein